MSSIAEFDDANVKVSSDAVVVMTTRCRLNGNFVETLGFVLNKF